MNKIELLTPQNSVLLVIDHQPQMAFGVVNIDRQTLKNNMDRMIQAGVVPVTWQQVLLEWQRDWARKETYDATLDVVKEHSGAYGMGVDYAYTMLHKAPQRAKSPGKTVK
jgi:nicotinamidase-related amidase